MNKIKIITVIGARPQFIKASSLSREIAKHNNIEDINKYKENSRKAAEILNVETNNRRMKEIIEELLN